MSSPELDNDPPPVAYNTPPALIAFTLTILVLCFVAFTVAYLCKYCFSTVLHTWTFTRTASGTLVRLSPERTAPPPGLDPTLLQGFPTFVYSSVKDLRKEKSYSLECAICLLEFEDDSMLRLLTICCHVFHQECIDLWLCSHKTCPVCRTDLESPPDQIPKPGGDENNAQESMVCDDHISIDIREGESNGVCESSVVGDQRNEHERRHMSMSTINMLQQEEHKFARSHSTGHSIVMIRGEGGEERDDDKYTLRLPEHVIRRGHNITRSCTNYNEIIAPTPCSNCGFVQPVASSSLAIAQKS